MIRFRTGPHEAGERIDVVLARRAEVTRARAQRALRQGMVSVSGAPVRPSHRVEEGEEVEADLPDDPRALPEAEPIALRVLHSDDRVLVVSKPPGLVTHPAAGHDRGTLVNALLGLGVPLASAGSTRPGIVHRLDKDTSGALLVAKDDDAHRFLVAALRRRAIERGYWALVRGPLPAPTGTVDAPVGRHPRRRRMMAVVPEGRPAVTHYRVVASRGAAVLLDVRLETGRTHQIRVHLAHLSHPVLGDRVYGGESDLARALGLTRPFLHAYRLRWPDPDHGGMVEVTDRLPPDLAAALVAAGLEPPA